MKSNQQIAPAIAADMQSITFAINDGGQPLILHMDRLHSDIVRRAACVGMAQVRIIDAAAIGAADKDGTIRTPAERMALKRAAMSRLIEHYETGTDQWAIRERAERDDSGLTIAAIARVKGIDVAETERLIDAYALRKYDGDRKAALAFLRKGAEVSKAIAAIRIERQGIAAIDADEALGELN